MQNSAFLNVFSNTEARLLVLGLKLLRSRLQAQRHPGAPSSLYLVPSSADGERERLLGGGQRVGDLGDGSLP